MIRGAVLVVAVYLAIILQDVIPPLGFLDGAHLIFVPVLFCYAALRLSFPAMLAFALYTGLLSDLANLHVIGDRVEIGLGWSMLFYVFVGSVLSGIPRPQPAERWEVHCLTSATTTLLLLLVQYLMVSLRRESFYFDETVVWHIAGPAVLALFIAPVIHAIFRFLPAGGLHRSRQREHVTQ